MTSPIQFDHHFLLRTAEVGNVRPDDRLPSKFEISKLPVSQKSPEFFLVSRLFFSQLPAADYKISIHPLGSSPSPWPSPQGERESDPYTSTKKDQNVFFN